MMRRIKQSLAIVALAGVLSIPAITQADSHEQELTGVYKERHELMEANKKSIGAIYAMLTGEADFDLDAVKSAAAVIVESSGDNLLAVFPPGTNEAPSEALDVVWTDWDDYSAKAHALTETAQAVADATDQESATAAFGPMGGSCKACHDKFRLKKEE